jgi:PTS system ascorbate-specific IIA component
MIGILIISHGTLGESLIHSVSHVLGTRPPMLQQFSIGAHDDPVTLLPQAQKMVEALDDGHGVLILSDIYGATPSNLVGKLLQTGRVEGIAGINLPMLVRVLTYRNGSLDMLVEKAVSGGREGVVHFDSEACKHRD